MGNFRPKRRSVALYRLASTRLGPHYLRTNDQEVPARRHRLSGGLVFPVAHGVWIHVVRQAFHNSTVVTAFQSDDHIAPVRPAVGVAYGVNHGADVILTSEHLHAVVIDEGVGVLDGFHVVR